MSNINDELRRREKWLAGMMKPSRAEDELRQRLQNARQNNAPKAHIREIETQLENLEGLNKQAVESAKAKISELRAEVKAEEDASQATARAELDALKSKASAAWVANGGTASEFEASWGDMKADILKARALEAMRASS